MLVRDPWIGFFNARSLGTRVVILNGVKDLHLIVLNFVSPSSSVTRVWNMRLMDL